MGQVTIYLEDEIEAKMRNTVKKLNISQSKWIANLVKEKIADEWPEAVKQLSGSWQDFPSAEEIRQDAHNDVPREPF